MGTTFRENRSIRNNTEIFMAELSPFRNTYCKTKNTRFNICNPTFIISILFGKPRGNRT